MLWEAVGVFEDYAGNRAETRQVFDASGSIENLFSSISTWSAIIEQLSDAVLVGGYARYSQAASVSSQAQVSSSAYRRLLILCRDGNNLASVSIPSPRPLPFENSGAYRNYRIPENQVSASSDLQNLVTVLSGTVTRFNKPFPTDRIMVALLENVL